MAMLEDARQQFPELVGLLICLGMPVGVTLGIWGEAHSKTQQPKFSWGRAIVAGGLAGTLGGLVFGRWVSSGEYYPLLAGFGELSSRSATVSLHFAVALLIGASFGVLFQRDVRGYGSCMGWGLGYAIFWWFMGPLTVLRAAAGLPLDWSAEQASVVFGSLVGHILYGLILGVAYATFDRVWVRLFIQSDPLNREVEGPGLRLLRSLEWGALAGLVGGLASSPIMLATGVLPTIAGLDTRLSTFGGLLIHLLVSALIGMSYGLLFRNEASSVGLGIAWGWVFGMIWWYVGPMTLLPLMLTGCLRLEHRCRFRLAPIPDGSLDLRRGDSVYVSPAGTSLHALAAAGSTNGGTRTTPHSPGGHTSACLMVFRVGPGRAVTHPPGMRCLPGLPFRCAEIPARDEKWFSECFDRYFRDRNWG